MTQAQPLSIFHGPLVRQAIKDSLAKLSPALMAKNPVMFVVEVGSVLTTLIWLRDLLTHPVGAAPAWFTFNVALWLWFTVIFANFAEALAEGRGKAQAAALRGLRKETMARLLRNGKEEQVPASELRKGDVVVVEAGQIIPGDGEVVEGIAPNEVALHVLLSGMTIIFLIACVTLVPFGIYSGLRLSVTVIVALLVCLIPTTIGGLISAIGIAGMDRLIRKNIIPMSGRAVEAAGDVDTILLDKTGTITLGNRMASDFIPAPGVKVEDLADVAQLASLADETPEGRSIVVLAKERYALRARDLTTTPFHFVPFTAQTRMSGADLNGRVLRKGAADAVRRHVEALGGSMPEALVEVVTTISQSGGTPLAVSDGAQVLGIVHLKDKVKGGLRERFDRFRAMGLRTVMITGDNPLTARAIAEEAGVDDFMAEATPEEKLRLIRAEQAKGKLVAMTGDGTNDAPALAQADVAIAMNTGTQAAKEAGNMVDLDSNPTKLLEVVEVGKQLLMTRGCLTTFSIANDVAKYFAILPALFMAVFPEIAPLNVMHLTSPESAILSAVVFNALIIVILIPLALRGVKYRPMGAAALLRRSLLIYGLGGVIVPFVGIKVVDMVLSLVGLT